MGQGRLLKYLQATFWITLFIKNHFAKNYKDNPKKVGDGPKNQNAGSLNNKSYAIADNCPEGGCEGGGGFKTYNVQLKILRSSSKKRALIF
jgi:hypothetical protein